MAIGTQPTQGSINATMTALALEWRNLATQTLDQQGFLNSLTQSGLVALGFSSQDAAGILAAIDYMGTLAQVYRGTATQGSEFDFDNALTPLWAGQ